MLTKDVLDQLAKVIDERLDAKLRAEREHTRYIVREELAANKKVIGTIVRVEIAAVKEALAKKVEKRITRLEEDMSHPEFLGNLSSI